MKRFKALFTLALISQLTNAAPGDFEIRTRTVHAATTVVNVELNSETVKCSHADYQAPFLKILIPELANLTVFDHRNQNEGAPCVAAGPCMSFTLPGEEPPPSNLPKDIIDASNPTEDVAISVKLNKVFHLDNVKQTCLVELVEHVEIPIRGKTFLHARSQSLGERNIADCK